MGKPLPSVSVGILEQEVEEAESDADCFEGTLHVSQAKCFNSFQLMQPR